MKSFTYDSRPSRVIFGCDSVGFLSDEVSRLGRKALVLCSAGQRPLAEAMGARLGGSSAGIFPGSKAHVPIEIVRLAKDQAIRLGADVLIAVGGGSTVGLGKALA